MFTPGITQLVVVLLIGLLFFGNRLPGTMRSIGQSLKEFKKGMKEGEEEDDDDNKKESDA
ncbi:MAG: twin-arginine translocase TatA/TatE family subunit [Planctomycetaceae bacterium]|nr:twin-arginine translocase TatA/TatE family subunit [Planctomycetaceae bacterium]MCA9045467.1 twin-arginine translocase TatA/TatE family subunit [Planctomycetaceae bacterium]MCB9952391.1 twin-arginine translocase TatA/TatE family subunit [Planctomycetaceae bacterium]